MNVWRAAQLANGKSSGWRCAERVSALRRPAGPGQVGKWGWGSSVGAWGCCTAVHCIAKRQGVQQLGVVPCFCRNGSSRSPPTEAHYHSHAVHSSQQWGRNHIMFRDVREGCPPPPHVHAASRGAAAHDTLPGHPPPLPRYSAPSCSQATTMACCDHQANTSHKTNTVGNCAQIPFVERPTPPPRPFSHHNCN